MRRLLPWVPVALALGLFVAPFDPALVERWYSERLYLQLQPRITAVSNLVPFAVFDVILLATVAIVLSIVAAAIRGLGHGQRWRAGGMAAMRLLAVGACLYIWFLA